MLSQIFVDIIVRASKYMLPEAICPKCRIKWYSYVLKQGGVFLCPECGEPLRLTGRNYHISYKYISPSRRQRVSAGK